MTILLTDLLVYPIEPFDRLASSETFGRGLIVSTALAYSAWRSSLFGPSAHAGTMFFVDFDEFIAL